MTLLRRRLVAVVNESFVKKFFPKEDPIGKHFGTGGMENAGAFEIVGVIADFKMNDVRRPPRRLFLRPLPQHYTGFKHAEDATGELRSMFIDAVILHYKSPQPNVEQTVRRTLAAIDPNLTITNLRPYDDQVAGNFTQERLLARLTSLFGILALILASVGLYGVQSYLVARRTGEIGIRMALGATRSSVLGNVMRSALVQIVLGLALGIPVALLAGHLMATQLYGVGAYDPWAFAGATGLLAGCAVLASLVPARRAASIEPMQALRTE